MTWPASFMPKRTYDLIRLGGGADGGYLVERRSVETAGSLISLGICDDWRFEAEFLGLNDVPLAAFDHTTGARLFTKVFLNRFLSFASGRASFRNVIHSARKPLEYKHFFRDTRCHERRKVGFQGAGSTDLNTILLGPRSRSPVFLKIDIEGWEYRILNDIIRNQKKICGLVIEWHDVDLHYKMIENFISEISLQLVHVHPNNYADIDRSGNAIALEMSFAADPVPIGDHPSIPHPLDRPNDSSRPEITLKITDASLPGSDTAAPNR